MTENGDDIVAQLKNLATKMFQTGNWGEDLETTKAAMDTIVTLRELARLGQPAQQEPVAWKHDCAALLQNDVELWIDHCPHCGKPRATPPAPAQEPDDLMAAYMSGLYDGKKQRTWVDLTDEEIKEVKAQVSQIPPIDFTSTTYARAFEVKLKEKNI